MKFNPEVRKIGSPRRCHANFAGADRGKRALQLCIVLGCGIFYLGAFRQDRYGSSFGLEVRSRIGEQQYAQLQAGFACADLCVGQIARALLLLQLRFDYIGVGALARGLALIGLREEALGLIRGASCSGELRLRRVQSVVEIDYGCHQSAACDFEFRLGLGRICVRQRHCSNSL